MSHESLSKSTPFYTELALAENDSLYALMQDVYSRPEVPLDIITVQENTRVLAGSLTRVHFGEHPTVEQQAVVERSVNFACILGSRLTDRHGILPEILRMPETPDLDVSAEHDYYKTDPFVFFMDHPKVKEMVETFVSKLAPAMEDREQALLIVGRTLENIETAYAEGKQNVAKRQLEAVMARFMLDLDGVTSPSDITWQAQR